MPPPLLYLGCGQERGRSAAGSCPWGRRWSRAPCALLGPCPIPTWAGTELATETRCSSSQKRVTALTLRREIMRVQFSFLFLLLFFLQYIQVERDFLLKQFMASG